eukprot:TRINITY_DN3082_c0_g1_i1.p1 TRINITY_DN3082_c0_g1~~TRINITY_DN3082_c0_g1_i1.p1  ORF type:complete len:926 (-),score=180.71 TRINITY_DN3082_c0_g1_i1:115-2892(-)
MDQTVYNVNNKKLKTIPNEILSFVNLTSLSLAFNKIPDIDKICRVLVNLKTMNFSNNLVRSIPPSILNCTALTSINFYNNQISKITTPLSTLTNLKKCDFGLNRLNDAAILNIITCTSLVEISLISNSIKILPGDLDQLQKLQRIDLSFNYLKSLPNLKNLANLTSIVFNDNYIEEIDNLPITISDIKSIYNNIKTIKQNYTHLKKVEIMKSDLESIDCECLMASANTLYHLDLSKNNIASLSDNFFSLKFLSTLNLSGNKLESLPNLFSSLEKLTNLDISRNMLKSFSEVCSAPKLKFLRLHNNEIEKFPPELVKLTEVLELDLSYNRIEEITNEILSMSKLSIFWIDSNNLKNLWPYKEENALVLNRESPNHILVDIKEQNSSENTYTMVISDFSAWGNRIKEIPSYFFTDLHTNLQRLNLSLNEIEELPSTIQLATNLRKLIVGHNRLKVFPDTFVDLKALGELSVPGNRIETIDNLVLPSLSSIVISNNSLKELPMDLATKFSSLQTLVANNNLIEKIEMNSEITQSSLTELNLSYNRFSTLSNFFNVFIGVEDMDISNNHELLLIEMQPLVNLKILKLMYCSQLDKINFETPHLILSQIVGIRVDADVCQNVLSKSEMNNSSSWRDANDNIFWAEMKGRRPSQEDSLVCVVEEFPQPYSSPNLSPIVQTPYSLFSVFDGHGGSFVSNYLAKNLVSSAKQIYEKWTSWNEETLGRLFTKLNKDLSLCYKDRKRNGLDKEESGATAAIVVVYGNSLFWGICGDSRVVYYSCSKQEIIHSNDHHGSLRSERDRIKLSNGYLTESNRLMGDLMVTKSFGDFKYKKYGMNCEPEIGSINQVVKGDFCIIACDGLWDVVSSQEAVKIVNENMANKKSRHLVATILRDIDYSRNNTDNISFLVIFCSTSSKLKKPKKQSSANFYKFG